MPLTKVKSGGVSDSITLTSPDINAPDIDGGTIDNAVIGGSTAAAGSFTTITATGGSSSNWNTAYGWGDHSTQSYATQTYVGTAVSNLVDSSPAALDTLNELAAALGDDPNFATTVTNSIALKAPLANPSFTGAATFNSTGTFAGGSTNFDNTADVVTLNGSLHTRLLIDTSSTGGHQAAIVLESNGNQSSIGNTGSNTSFAVAAGNLTLDVAGEIILDADQNGVVRINDAGSNFGAFFKNGTTFTLKSELADYDMIFSGNDGGATINALTLDMSAAGAATFNSTVTHTGLTLDYNTSMYGTDKTLSTYSASNGVYLNGNASGWLQLAGDGARNTRINLFGDGNSAANQITFHTNNVHSMSLSAGGAIFNETGIDRDFRVESSGNNHMLFVDGGLNQIGIGDPPRNSTYSTAPLVVQARTKYADNTMYALQLNSSTYGDTGEYTTMLGFAVEDSGWSKAAIGYTRTGSYDTGYLAFYTVDGGAQANAAMANEALRITGSAVVVNERGRNLDFRVESDTGSHMLFVDAGGGYVTVGRETNLGSSVFTVQSNNNAGLAIGYGTGTNEYRRLYHHSSGLYFESSTNQAYLSASGAWINASDVTLKKDIEDIDYGIETVKNLKPRKYKMKSDDEAQIGFIAQELVEQVPEIVGGKEGLLGVSYGQLTAVLTKAIQEQQTLIESLTARIAALEA